LSDVDAAAVNGVLSACGNDIDDHRASVVSGEHSTGVDPVSHLTDVAQAMLDIAGVSYDLFLAITFNTSSLYQTSDTSLPVCYFCHLYLSCFYYRISFTSLLVFSMNLITWFCLGFVAPLEISGSMYFVG